MTHKPSWAPVGPAWPSPAAPVAMSGLGAEHAGIKIEEKRIGYNEWYSMAYALGITALSYWVFPPKRMTFRTSVMGVSTLTLGAYAVGRMVFWPGRDETKISIRY